MNFLCSRRNIDFYQYNKDTIIWDYNDGIYRDGYNKGDNPVNFMKYLFDEGFIDNIGISKGKTKAVSFIKVKITKK